jgi:aerobic C4-dicarboxylate transport protein
MTTARRPWYTVLYVQVLIAIAVGIIIGHFFPDAGVALKPLGDGFISLIKMMIAPVIFCTVVHGIGSMRDLKKVGRVGVKTLFYFEAVSTLALVIGLVVGKLLQPGKGFDIVISRWEGELDVGRLNKVMAHPVALGEEFEDQPA